MRSGIGVASDISHVMIFRRVEPLLVILQVPPLLFVEGVRLGNLKLWPSFIGKTVSDRRPSGP